jgi:hypothetical protein
LVQRECASHAPAFAIAGIAGYASLLAVYIILLRQSFVVRHVTVQISETDVKILRTLGHGASSTVSPDVAALRVLCEQML